MSDLQDHLDHWESWLASAHGCAFDHDTMQAILHVNESARKVANPDLIDVVFDGPPGPTSGRFIEVENQDRHSIRVGEWIERDDGYWVLRIAALGIDSEDT